MKQYRNVALQLVACRIKQKWTTSKIIYDKLNDQLIGHGLAD